MKCVKKLTNNYSVYDNRIAQSKLSLRAKGLYFYLCSLPDDWNFSIERIALVSEEPASRVKQAFEELQGEGLVERTFVYGDGVYGRRSDYILYDLDTRPVNKNDAPKPTIGKPPVGKPPIEKPPVEKPIGGLSTVEISPVGFSGDYKSNNINKVINNNKVICSTKSDADASQTAAKQKPKTKTKTKAKEFVPPTLNEVISFFVENGYTEESARKCFNHYDYLNWHDVTGKPVLNWKQKVNTNWFTEDNKISHQVNRPNNNYNRQPHVMTVQERVQMYMNEDTNNGNIFG